MAPECTTGSFFPQPEQVLEPGLDSAPHAGQTVGCTAPQAGQNREFSGNSALHRLQFIVIAPFCSYLKVYCTTNLSRFQVLPAGDFPYGIIAAFCELSLQNRALYGTIMA